MLGEDDAVGAKSCSISRLRRRFLLLSSCSNGLDDGCGGGIESGGQSIDEPPCRI
jgi:hypothetical protein